MRVLITGWPSFRHGEATAGDVRSMHRIADALRANAIPFDTVWSPRFAPGELEIDTARPENYSHVVFVCGPVHGWQLEALHRRYAGCRRIAVGVSVVDPANPAVLGFHEVLPRDGYGCGVSRDLGVPHGIRPVPVAGIVLAPGQREYGGQRRHEIVHDRVLRWLSHVDCAPLPLDTRLDPGDWRMCSTVDQFAGLLSRADIVITSRLHGLVFALAQAVPALAIDPVSGGGKVGAQAEAWQWPAVLTPEDLATTSKAQRALDHWWQWCCSAEGRTRARDRAQATDCAEPLVAALLRSLHADCESAESA